MVLLERWCPLLFKITFSCFALVSSSCIWHSTISSTGTVAVRGLPDPSFLAMLPLAIHFWMNLKIPTRVQTRFSSKRRFLIAGALSPCECQYKILCCLYELYVIIHRTIKILTEKQFALYFTHTSKHEAIRHLCSHEYTLLLITLFFSDYAILRYYAQ